MLKYDIVVIGGGPAGLTAAIAAKEEGIEKILIIEREEQLGGILNQFIHAGFEHKGEKNLTGPEYTQRLIDDIDEFKIQYMLNSLVSDISKEKVVTVIGEKGILEIQAKAIVLAMGYREKPRGTMNILGSKAAGIFTAGTVQKFVNVDGYMPGKQVVILGSESLGLIMARRMKLEGANVKALVEISAHIHGGRKEAKECLTDFDIPLRLSHTVIDIKGEERIKGITIAKVDENKAPIAGTEEFIACDTLILSVGLLPENELVIRAGIKMSESTSGPEIDDSMHTSLEGVFACGNVLYVHSLIDEVIEESIHGGKNAARFLMEKNLDMGDKI